MISERKKRLKAIHWDIIEQDEFNRFKKLKKLSGVNSDAEVCRWAFKQLETKLDQEEKDRQLVREIARKVQTESEESDK